MVTDPDEARRIPVEGPRPRFTITAYPVVRGAVLGTYQTLDPDLLGRSHPHLNEVLRNVLFWLTMTSLENPDTEEYEAALTQILTVARTTLVRHPAYDSAGTRLPQRDQGPRRERLVLRVQHRPRTGHGADLAITFFQTWAGAVPRA